MRLLVGKSSRSSPTSSGVDEDVEELRCVWDMSRADDDLLVHAVMVPGRFVAESSATCSTRAASVFRMAWEVAELSCWMRAPMLLMLVLLWLDGMRDADKDEARRFVGMLLGYAWNDVVALSHFCTALINRHIDFCCLCRLPLCLATTIKPPDMLIYGDIYPPQPSSQIL